MVLDRPKFKELVLYVALRSAEDAGFGRTKLNKVLFFSDFLAYQESGASITGAEYQKLEHGPAPRQMLPILRELLESGDASEVPRRVGTYSQRRLVAMRQPRLDLFSGQEIAVVDDVVDLLSGKGAVDVSELSHQMSLGWQVVDLNDTIPYGTVFWSRPDDLPTSEHEGRALAADLGLALV